MSTPSAHIHPLIEALRERVAQRGITQSQAAQELGVSERTVAYWMNEDVVPQKRQRALIQTWLEGSGAQS